HPLATTRLAMRRDVRWNLDGDVDAWETAVHQHAMGRSYLRANLLPVRASHLVPAALVADVDHIRSPWQSGSWLQGDHSRGHWWLEMQAVAVDHNAVQRDVDRHCLSPCS